MKDFDKTFVYAASEIAKFLYQNEIYSLDISVVYEEDGSFKITATNVKGMEETNWIDKEGCGIE